MTQQLQSTLAPDVMLDSLLRTARDRSARGNGSRRDWERVAAINPDLAYRELRDFLRRTNNAEFNPTNPFERRSHAPGALIGFIAGAAVMVAIWAVMPYMREQWVNYPVLRDFATGGQFLSTLFIPLGMIVGARWERRHANADTRMSLVPAKGASFEELLDLFERTQSVGRARVY
jgi:hypothetical protein